MSLRPTRRVVLFLALAAIAAAPAIVRAAGPELSATFAVTDVSPSGDSVHATFSYKLRSAQPSDLKVEAVKLGKPSAADHAYASFHGGTIPAGGELTGSAGINVPKSVYKKWKSGEPAALFVKTIGDSGSDVWTRVDATASAPIK